MFNFKPKTVALMGSLTLLCATAGISPAMASSDSSYHHGSLCQPYYGSQAGDFVAYTSGIKNISSGYRYVTCPIADDHIISKSADTLIYVYVYNAGGYFKCHAYTKNRYTGSTIDYDSVITDTTGNDYRLLKIRSSWGHPYVVTCNVPPRSFVRTLYLVEPR